MIVVPTTPAQISAVLEAARQNDMEIRLDCIVHGQATYDCGAHHSSTDLCCTGGCQTEQHGDQVRLYCARARQLGL